MSGRGGFGGSDGSGRSGVSGSGGSGGSGAATLAGGSFAGGEVRSVVPGVAVLTIDRPPVNALGAETYDGLAAVLRSLAGSDSGSGDVRAVVLTGEGTRAFSAGSDISEFGDPDSYARIAAASQGFFAALGALPVPIVGALNGPAVGAGAMIAAECDVLLAAPDAHLSIPELSLGVPGSGSHVKRLAPYFKVQRMLLLGERLTVEQAVAFGTVLEIVPAEELVAAAIAVAERIAALEADAVRAARSIFRAAESSAALAGYAAEMAAAVPIVSASIERRRREAG
jgi:enoyl-CoA hydratase